MSEVFNATGLAVRRIALLSLVAALDIRPLTGE